MNLGHYPQEILYDNMKQVVIKRALIALGSRGRLYLWPSGRG